MKLDLFTPVSTTWAVLRGMYNVTVFGVSLTGILVMILIDMATRDKYFRDDTEDNW